MCAECARPRIPKVSRCQANVRRQMPKYWCRCRKILPTGVKKTATEAKCGATGMKITATISEMLPTVSFISTSYGKNRHNCRFFSIAWIMRNVHRMCTDPAGQFSQPLGRIKRRSRNRRPAFFFMAFEDSFDNLHLVIANLEVRDFDCARFVITLRFYDRIEITE